MRSAAGELDFSVRYGENWDNAFLFLVHSATSGKCCFCLKRPSDEAHHIRYKDEQGAIADREKIGVDVFAVCGNVKKPGTCHYELHTKKYWIRDRANPVLGNRNTPEAIDRLRTGYLLLSG